MLKRRLKEPFGKAGLTVAILALVMAMVGGAYAAGKLNGTQKKEVEKIAKKYAGKPGAAGATGPAGANGTNGAAGKNGTAGKDGTDGKEGSPWTAGGVLPSGKTETGTWSVIQDPGSFVGGALEIGSASISFPIPLKEALAKAQAPVHIVPIGGPTPTGCSGSVAAPGAAKGNLCVFEAGPAINVGTTEVQDPETGEEEEVGTTGVLLQIHPETAGESIFAKGTWAVTAP